MIAARTASGETRCFAPVMNEHVSGILDVTTAPAALPDGVIRHATEIAIGIAEALKLVGVLAVEMFLVGEKILVNELAPRPHNSGHFSFDACVTSQFEQQLRAVCGLPLGDPTASQARGDGESAGRSVGQWQTQLGGGSWRI